MDSSELIQIYDEAYKFFYNQQNNLIQKSKHWESYNVKKFNSENLENFRAPKSLSLGLDDQNNRIHFKIFDKLIKKTNKKFVFDNLLKENIGNSNSVSFFNDVVVDYNKLIHIYWFWILKKSILENNKISNFCEIGGGFGSFAELFVKNFDSKIFLIDLPEANLMSTYYFKKLYPEKNFFLFSDYKKNKFLSKLDFDSHDIIILPPNCNIDKKIKIDLFVNTRSMMEMNYEVINSYFNFIQEHLIDKGYFLNINRYEKISVGHPIRMCEFPYDKNWNVVVSEPSFNQNWIHFLLTQRTFQEDKKNIDNELLKIKKIGEKFYVTNKSNNFLYKFFLKITNKIKKFFFGLNFTSYVLNNFYKILCKFKLN